MTPTALTLLALSLTSSAFAQKAVPVTIASTGDQKIFVRLEALNDAVVRVWYSTALPFLRKPSLAMETASKARVPLVVDRQGRNFRVRTKRLVLTVDPKSLEVTVFDAQTKARVVAPIRFVPSAEGKWSLTQGLVAEEHLMGLGEDNRNHGKLDRRGTVRNLWAGQQIRPGDVTADYPIPFMLSTGAKGHAYGLFFDNVHRLIYDLGKSQADQVKVDSEGGEADLYVIDGPRPKEVISRYTALTGRPSLPPLWTLGYLQSRCVFYNWNDVDGAYKGLRSRGYPVDALVIDYQWPEFLNDFVWDKRWTVNGVTPAQRVKGYADKGVNLMLYGMSPMVVKDSPTHKNGWDAGVFATDGSGKPVQAGYYNGDLLDFTAPNMNAWLWPQLRPRNMEGLNSWWLDLTEPEGEPPQTVYKGGRPAEIHNQFSILVSRSFEGSLLHDHPNLRPWILTRAGSAGIQRHNAALWTGDIGSDFATLSAHPGEMLNSGISGINWWTCDTGGFLTGFYKNDQFGAHARLYERWMQFSVFSPITRAHKAGLCMPYEFGPATEQGTKKYLNLRYRMLPYNYSNAVEAAETGVPMMRSMGVEFPDDPGSVAAKGDQYMFGPNLLVAPVVNEGVSKRPVYFPPGKWVDWDSGLEYRGGRTWVVDAPQNRIPVAVRPGAIIPMAPNMANTSAKWDTLTVEVFPSGKSTFTMVRDDGLTFAYAKGERTRTAFQSVEGPSGLVFSIRPSNGKFLPKRYLVRLHLDRSPRETVVDGQRARAVWDAEARVLSVKVEGGVKHEIRVGLASALPARPAPVLVADKVDPKGEARGGGSPTPHFFPGPTLPSVVKASNYDNGGEGVAFHIAHVPTVSSYRADNAGIVNGGLAGTRLVGLQKDDWLRYSVDALNGGYFDLVVHAEGQGSFRLLSADRTVASSVLTRGGDLVIPNVYLNPGSDSLMLYVDRGGFTLDSLEFRRAASAPSVYEAEWASRTGSVAVRGPGDGANGALGNVGQLTGSVTMGVQAAGAGRVRIRYANGGRDLSLGLSLNGGEPVSVLFPKTGSGWKEVEVALPFVAGSNRISLSWKTNSYDSIQLDRFEVIP